MCPAVPEYGAKRAAEAALRLSRNPLPNETEPGSNLAASQSFPARRRENKVINFKIPGHAPGILTYNRASVRLWRARSPMQILLRSKLALIESVSKRLFRHAESAQRTFGFRKQAHFYDGVPSCTVIARSEATWAARERRLWRSQATAAAGQALAFAQTTCGANA